VSGAGITEYLDGTIRDLKHHCDLLKSDSVTALFNRNLAGEIPPKPFSLSINMGLSFTGECMTKKGCQKLSTTYYCNNSIIHSSEIVV